MDDDGLRRLELDFMITGYVRYVIPLIRIKKANGALHVHSCVFLIDYLIRLNRRAILCRCAPLNTLARSLEKMTVQLIYKRREVPKARASFIKLIIRISCKEQKSTGKKTMRSSSLTFFVGTNYIIKFQVSRGDFPSFFFLICYDDE